jgi:hypothetical protein
MDRGFLGGPTMYWLDRQEITFVVPARSNMNIAQDARSLAQAMVGITETREESISKGRGMHKTEHLLATQITGIAGWLDKL